MGNFFLKVESWLLKLLIKRNIRFLARARIYELFKLFRDDLENIEVDVRPRVTLLCQQRRIFFNIYVIKWLEWLPRG